MHIGTITTGEMIACHDCDLLFRKRPLREGHKALCPRCGAVLYHRKRNSLDRTLMYALAGLVFYAMANYYPFLTFKMEGREEENNLISGVIELYRNGMLWLTVLVFCTSIFIPLVKLCGIAWLLIPLKFNRRPWKVAPVFRMVQAMHPWAMMEVYMLGVIVAYVKLSDMATVIPGIALFSFVVLILIVAAADGAWDPDFIWEKLEAKR